MYTTIEADIENGRIKSPDLRKLPAMAHVLITILDGSVSEMIERHSIAVKGSELTADRTPDLDSWRVKDDRN